MPTDLPLHARCPQTGHSMPLVALSCPPLPARMGLTVCMQLGTPGPWSRHPWGISGASLTAAWSSSLACASFSSPGHHVQLRGSRAPYAPRCPQPALFSTSTFEGFLRVSSALEQAFRAGSLGDWLSPPAGTQSRAWHRAGAQQTSVGGMTLDGETNSTQSPQVRIPLLLLVHTWWWQGTRAVGGQGRPSSPGWPDWVRAEDQAGQTNPL